MGKDSDRRSTPINWKEYNKKLVNRSKNLANTITAIQKYDHQAELDEMNKGKEGQPYQYSNSLILLFAVLKTVMGKGYRDLEGLAYMFLNDVPNYSAIQKRLAKFPKELLSGLSQKVTKAVTSGKGSIDIVMDATGIMVNKKHVWIDEKYKTRRKRDWKKLHLVVDAESGMILHAEVLKKNGNEGKHENFSNALSGALGNSSAPIRRSYNDGAYDSNKNFDLCKELGIDFVTRIRKPTIDSVKRFVNSRAVDWKRVKRFLGNPRNRSAIGQIDWKKFVEENRFGLRSAVEGIIGSFKSFFGESFFSKKDSNILVEVLVKKFVWNVMMQP